MPSFGKGMFLSTAVVLGVLAYWKYLELAPVD